MSKPRGDFTYSPVHRHREGHRRRDTQTSKTSVEARNGEDRGDQDGQRAKRVEAQEQPPVRHPEDIVALRRSVDLLVQVVHEALLGRESSDRDYIDLRLRPRTYMKLAHQCHPEAQRSRRRWATACWTPTDEGHDQCLDIRQRTPCTQSR